MLVLTAVSDVQRQRLQSAAGLRFALVSVATWGDALTTIRVQPVQLAVVDPLLLGSNSGPEMERLRVLFPSLPLILYTTLTPRIAALLLALGQRGVRHIVCTGYDDSPAHLREVLAEGEAQSAAHQLLEQLARALAPLPRELRWALEDALRKPAAMQRVQQVATRARIDRRTFERWFTRVGLPSPRHLLAAARVLYAHRLLQDPGFTVEDVAQRLGYSQAKTLRFQARTYLGLTAGEMWMTLAPEEVLQRVVRNLRVTRQSRASATMPAAPSGPGLRRRGTAMGSLSPT